MANPTRLEINCETNIVTEVELTDEEVLQMNTQAEAYAKQKADELAAEEAKQALRDQAIAHLQTLGLSLDQVEALLG